METSNMEFPGLQPTANIADIAFNSRLVGYHVGGSDRLPRLIVRFALGRSRTSSAQGEKTLEETRHDHSGAGQNWGETELDIWGADMDELVVVVGVLLPDEVELPTPSAGSGLTPLTSADFDPARHILLQTMPGTRVVVRRLSTRPGNLFVLADKDPVTGLCSIKSPPPTIRYRLFFYREWTEVGELDTINHNVRLADWKRGLTEFAKPWFDSYNSPPAAGDSAEPTAPDPNALN